MKSILKLTRADALARLHSISEEIEEAYSILAQFGYSREVPRNGRSRLGRDAPQIVDRK